MTKWKVLTPDESGEVVVTNTFDIGFLGYNKTYNDAEVRGGDASNPQEQGFFHVFVTPMTGLNVDAVVAVVQIDYDALMIEPQLPSTS
ncbi:hypothetical protein [Shewanella sp.]|uniref:hypothetical protein n=1 Tax=Shewanella sp. TaxID=50422 RepID=UPI004047253F